MYKFIRLTNDLSRNWNAARKIQKVFRGYRARIHFRDTMRRVAIACRSIRAELVGECLTQMYFSKYAKANARRMKERNLRRVVAQYATWRTSIYFRTMILAARCIQRYSRAFYKRLIWKFNGKAS